MGFDYELEATGGADPEPLENRGSARQQGWERLRSACTRKGSGRDAGAAPHGGPPGRSPPCRTVRPAALPLGLCHRRGQPTTAKGLARARVPARCADGEGCAAHATPRKSSTQPARQERAAAAHGPSAFAPPQPAAASLREPEPQQGSRCSGHPLLRPALRPGRRRLPARPWLSLIAAAAAASAPEVSVARSSALRLAAGSTARVLPRPCRPRPPTHPDYLSL